MMIGTNELRAALLLVAVLYFPCVAAPQTPQSPFLDVRSFGAACNNKTDDSMALQNAINTGIAKGQPVYVPGGTCVHESTLTMNKGHTSVRLLGTPLLSVLKYTGPGSGWVWKNGDGTAYVYNPIVIGLDFFCGNATGCARGIEAYSVSEGVFRDVHIGQSEGVFSTAWFCSNCSIMDIDHLVLSATSKAATPAVGLDCLGCAGIIIRSGDFYYFPTATLRFSGPTNQIVIDSNWFEAEDTAILFDDSNAGGAITSDLISIVNNRFLFNGASGVPAKEGTFQHQVALRFHNAAGKLMNMTGVLFGPGNSVFCAYKLCNADTPIIASVSPSTAPDTEIDVTIRENTIRGVRSGIITSNSYKVNAFLQNNRNIGPDRKAITKAVVGTATLLH